MKYLIKDKQSGTYYKQMTGIGPMYGATKDEAMKFDTEKEAIGETCKHSYGFMLAEIKSLDV